jgi:hypothetical protein
LAAAAITGWAARRMRNGAVPGIAGVVDDDIDPPEGIDGRADEALAEIGRGHVAGADHRAHAERLDLARGLVRHVGVEIVDDDMRTGARELERDRLADPPPRSRDERDLVLQNLH